MNTRQFEGESSSLLEVTWFFFFTNPLNCIFDLLGALVAQSTCSFQQVCFWPALSLRTGSRLRGAQQIYPLARSAGNEVRRAEEGEPARIFLNAGCHPQKPRGELSLSAVKFQPISAAGSQNPNQSKQIMIHVKNWRSLESKRHDSRRNS